MMGKIEHFFNVLFSYLIAILRLMFLAVSVIFDGIQIILFSRTEVARIELKGLPLRCDRKSTDDKLAFIDKLCLGNPDIAGILEELDESLIEEDLDDGDQGEPA